MMLNVCSRAVVIDDDGSVCISSDGGDSWHRRPVAAWRGREAMCAAAIGTHILVTGGRDDEPYAEKIFADVWHSLDGGSSWQELPEPPWPARAGHTLTAVQDRLFLHGGRGEDGSFLSDAWISRDRGRSWAALPDAPVGRSGHWALPWEETLVVMGGKTGSGRGQPTNDVLVLESELWSPEAHARFPLADRRRVAAILRVPLLWRKIGQAGCGEIIRQLILPLAIDVRFYWRSVHGPGVV